MFCNNVFRGQSEYNFAGVQCEQKKKKEKKVAGRYLSIQETDSKDGFLFQAAGS